MLTADEDDVLDVIGTEQLDRIPSDGPFSGMSLSALLEWLNLDGRERSETAVSKVITSLKKKGLVQRIAGAYWVTEKGEIAWSKTFGGAFSTAVIDFVRFYHPELTDEVKDIGYDIPPLPSKN